MTHPIGSGSGSGTRPDTFDTEVAGPIPTGTGEELLQQVIAMLDDQRSQARSARAAGRTASRNQARARIGKMREAADFKLASSVVNGVSTAASSSIQNTGDQALAKSGSTVATGVLDWLASRSETDAEMNGLGSQIAKDGADDANELMQAAAQRSDRALQKLDAILQAEVDASRAAIRRG